MPLYMYQVGYTPEAWDAQVKAPKNRMDAIRPVIRAMGGRVIEAYYTFGKDDLICIAQMPDNATAAGFSMAAAAGGSVTHIHTTPLMTIPEGIKAMRAAKRSKYAPPK